MKTTMTYLPHDSKKNLTVDLLENACYHPSPETVLKNKERLVIKGVIKHTVGQDTIISKNLNANETVVGVFDGHGALGHYHSFIASSLLTKLVVKCIPLLKLHLQTNNEGAINELLTYCYNFTQKQLYNGNFHYIDKESGTTASLALVLLVNVNGKKSRRLISTNAGDSPILWKDDSTYTECSLEHNCDNKLAVEAYLKRLAVRKETIKKQINEGNITPNERSTLNLEYFNCEPKPVYYFRKDNPVAVWMKSLGYNNPLTLYNYHNNKPELNKTDYEIISEYYPHGYQSIRTPETYVREDGRTVAVSGKEHDNWGSSLMGGTQTLNGLGDIQNFPHVSPDPFVSIHDINNKGSLFVASDGFTDLFHLDRLMDFIHQHHNKEHLEETMLDYLFDTALTYKSHYPFKQDQESGVKYPKWDDVSGIIVSLPECV